MQEQTNLLLEWIRNIAMIQLDTMLYRCAPQFNHTGRNADYGRAIGHFIQYDRIGSDQSVVADAERPEEFGSGSHQNIIAQGWVPLAFIFTGTAKRHPIGILCSYRRFQQFHQ